MGERDRLRRSVQGVQGWEVTEHYMTTYERMIKTNHHLIKGGELTDAQKANIVRQLLAAQSDERTQKSFCKGVNAPEYLSSLGMSTDDRIMYPLYYIPPYNEGKKYQTVIPMSPKTHILSANSYELEIIRLLYMFAPDNPRIKDMAEKTLARLKTTCYGYHDCAHGECFHTALIVLRFIAATAPDDTKWINRLFTFFKRNMDEKLALKGKGIHSNILWYYWLCLSELPLSLAEPEIRRYKEKIIVQLSRSSVMNSENDKTNHPVMICAIRNALARLPEYADIKDRRPYESKKDGRLHFDMSRLG